MTDHAWFLVAVAGVVVYTVGLGSTVRFLCGRYPHGRGYANCWNRNCPGPIGPDPFGNRCDRAKEEAGFCVFWFVAWPITMIVWPIVAVYRLSAGTAGTGDRIGERSPDITEDT